ncbi:hypothetical protein Syun_007890 [Stephania yunnanensis]|uniref:Uncharacterized protein n=1 Tax=Stephania yunnanensis TaxID=152371 RepID=A0AAP0L333_9MAGN
MAEMKQRFSDQPTTATTTTTTTDPANKPKTRTRSAMAKRGLRSLLIAVATPTCLTLLALHSSKHAYNRNNGHATDHSIGVLFPPWWAAQLGWACSSVLIGLASWLVWAEGGFHKKPNLVPLYVAQFGLGLAWNAVVFGVGEVKVGLGLCFAWFGAVFGCYKSFKRLNPIAADLVKPCLVWVVVLVALNVKLLRQP